MKAGVAKSRQSNAEVAVANPGLAFRTSFSYASYARLGARLETAVCLFTFTSEDAEKRAESRRPAP